MTAFAENPLSPNVIYFRSHSILRAELIAEIMAEMINGPRLAQVMFVGGWTGTAASRHSYTMFNWMTSGILLGAYMD